MKMLLSPCLLLSAVILAGCGTMKIETGAPVFAPPGDKGTASREALQERTEFGGLFQAANQMGLGPQGKAARSPEGPLPSALVSSPLMQKLVKANLYAVQAGTGRGLSNENFEDIQFKRRDFKHFVLNVVPALGVNSWAENNQPGSHANARTTDTDRKSEAFQRIQKYLAAYVAGKFVDRSGAFIAKPKIENNKIGNDSIVGFLTVILEATYDCLYSTPVFYETNSGKIVWLNAGGKEPCFAALAKDDQGSYNVKFVQEVSNTSNITTSEVHAMQFFASVASDQSKLLSGLAMRMFNDLQLSYVIGGSFAVGDNDTLAKVVDTFFETSSYRSTEALAYLYFKDHSKSDYGAGMKDLFEVLEDVYKNIK